MIGLQEVVSGALKHCDASSRRPPSWCSHSVPSLSLMNINAAPSTTLSQLPADQNAALRPITKHGTFVGGTLSIVCATLGVQNVCVGGSHIAVVVPVYLDEHWGN